MKPVWDESRVKYLTMHDFIRKQEVVRISYDLGSAFNDEVLHIQVAPGNGPVGLIKLRDYFERRFNA